MLRIIYTMFFHLGNAVKSSPACVCWCVLEEEEASTVKLEAGPILTPGWTRVSSPPPASSSAWLLLPPAILRSTAL